jgi:hypothetical protein
MFFIENVKKQKMKTFLSQYKDVLFVGPGLLGVLHGGLNKFLDYEM